MKYLYHTWNWPNTNRIALCGPLDWDDGTWVATGVARFLEHCDKGLGPDAGPIVYCVKCYQAASVQVLGKVEL